MPVLLQLSIVESETSWCCKRGTRRHACARVRMSTMLSHDFIICSCSRGWVGELGVRLSAAGDLRCDLISDITANGALGQNRKPWLSACESTSACVCCTSVCGPCLYLTMRACAYLVLVRSLRLYLLLHCCCVRLCQLWSDCVQPCWPSSLKTLPKPNVQNKETSVELEVANLISFTNRHFKGIKKGWKGRILKFLDTNIYCNW